MTEIHYVVHSAHATKVNVTAHFAGRDVKADVDGLIVELVSEDGTMTHTLRLLPTDHEDAQRVFAVGNQIKATFELVSVADSDEDVAVSDATHEE